ncbi:MAG: DUF4197 domain-containing protein [Chitinophagaceae bacterium]|nr:MAG: DUF4197 domain-containing protein [Chitinophagaceae bacterium]
MNLMFLRNLLIAASIFTFAGCETLSLPTMGPSTGIGPVTESEAGMGIKEALSQGIGTAIVNLNKENAFFGNDFYKVLLPADALKVENTLRKVGLGKEVDKAILQINRAAEDAVGYAKPIFVDAIREMSITDALNIVKGGKNSATEFFRVKTREKLLAAFAPSVKQSLDKLGATKYYSDIVNLYNNIPTTMNKINPDLPSYVVGKTTDALFDQIAKEEVNIRENPVARTTAILKRVFGSK